MVCCAEVVETLGVADEVEGYGHFDVWVDGYWIGCMCWSRFKMGLSMFVEESKIYRRGKES